MLVSCGALSSISSKSARASSFQLQTCPQHLPPWPLLFLQRLVFGPFSLELHMHSFLLYNRSINQWSIKQNIETTMEYICCFEAFNILSERPYFYGYVHKPHLLFAYPWVESKVMELDPRLLGRMENNVSSLESIFIILDLAPLFMRQPWPMSCNRGRSTSGSGFATVTCRPPSCWELLTLAQRQPPAHPRHGKALVEEETMYNVNQ